MPKITLYGQYGAPSCRTVGITAKALGIDIDFVKTNPMSGETKTPEFLAINPMHSIPTIVDGNFVLWESRAIQTYLVQKYGEDDSFYPNELETRATVDRLLYFDMGTLFSRYINYMGPVMFKGAKPDADDFDKVKDALKMLDYELDGKMFVVGDKATVADHSLASSVTSMEAGGLETGDFKNIAAWLQRCKSWSYYDEEIMQGETEYGDFVRPKLFPSEQ